MAADGDRKRLHRAGAWDGTWSSDATVRRYQEFCAGYRDDDKHTFFERLYFKLPWCIKALEEIDLVLSLPREAQMEHDVRLAGAFRSGKTRLIREVIRKRMPNRGKEGLSIPLGYVPMPPVPSPATVGETVLFWLGDPTWAFSRSPTKRLIRIAEVADQVGLLALAFDDLQHLVDSRGQKVQHTTADYLIGVGFYIKVPMIFCGLERMNRVFEVNEQLGGRTNASIAFRRLDWTRTSDRALFTQMVELVIGAIKDQLGSKIILTAAFVFRMYCATGGIPGYLFRVLRVAVAKCERSRRPLCEEEIQRAMFTVVARRSAWPRGIDPFHKDFSTKPSPQILKLVSAIGIGAGPGK